MSDPHVEQGDASPAAASIAPIRKSAAPLRHNVVDALRAAIVEGRLAPGARLIERELIAMTGVSRTVIREALRQLESEGVVEILPNKGPIVRKLTLPEAKDLYLIRSVLEGLAARKFVENAGEADVAELGRALEETADAYRSGGTEILAAKNRFYDILIRGARSETLSSMIAALHARVWRFRAHGLGHPKRTRTRSQQSLSELRRLLGAIERRDADLAEEIARREVTNAAAELLHLLEEDDSGRGR
jgi:DNA-binding GntR family transcriptional regulator